MKVTQVRKGSNRQVCADTRALLDAADAALEAAWTAMDEAGDAMLRNGDGDLWSLHLAVGTMLAARRQLNA